MACAPPRLNLSGLRFEINGRGTRNFERAWAGGPERVGGQVLARDLNIIPSDLDVYAPVWVELKKR